MYYTYILRCKDGSLYTGITTDVNRRFKEHQRKKGGNYTRTHKAQEIVYIEACGDRGTALKREHEIKKLERAQKLALVSDTIRA